jgi:hypothetical protein
MKETIIQEPFELKFGSRTATIINGKKVFKIEERVKVNENGDCGFLNLTVPAQLAKTKTIRLKITADSAQKLEKGLQSNDQAGITRNVSSTIGKRTKETPNLYEIKWAKATQSGRIQIWAATPVEAYKLAEFDKFSDRAYQGIREIS